MLTHLIIIRKGVKTFPDFFSPTTPGSGTFFQDSDWNHLMKAVSKILPATVTPEKVVNGLLAFLCINLFAFSLLSLFTIVQWLF